MMWVAAAAEVGVGRGQGAVGIVRGMVWLVSLGLCDFHILPYGGSGRPRCRFRLKL